MIYCYFSCSKDERLLAASIASLRAVEPEAVVYVANDENDRASVPEGCHEVLTRYQRGGTGMGLPAVEGELLTMQHILKEQKGNYVVKLDSDMWVNDTTALQVLGKGDTEPDFLGYETASMLQPSGGVYRLSKWAVDYALAETQQRWQKKLWNPSATYSENFTIFRLVCLAPTLHAHLIPYGTHRLVGMHDDGFNNNRRAHLAEFVHCGEPLDGATRVAREHVFTRMALLRSEAALMERKTK